MSTFRAWSGIHGAARGLGRFGSIHLYATHRRRIAQPALGGAGRAPAGIRMIAEEVGGGFGVRFNLYPEYCAALFAAKNSAAR